MKANSPAARRKFANEWDEIGYLYDKLLYWLYQREDAAKARRYAERLEKLLPAADPSHEAILGEECWSLVYEARGDLAKAIDHRENEVRLIRRLHDASRNAPPGGVALKKYGPDALSDRLDLLATLYHDRGDLDKAVGILQESQRLCEAHGIAFDGRDLLRDYLAERGEPRKGSRARAV